MTSFNLERSARELTEAIAQGPALSASRLNGHSRPRGGPGCPGSPRGDSSQVWWRSLRQRQQAVGVALGVSEEANQVALVVNAVDRRRARAAYVHARVLAALPGEAMGDGRVAGPGGVGADDLIGVVDAERLGHRGTRVRERDEPAGAQLEE